MVHACEKWKNQFKLSEISFWTNDDSFEYSLFIKTLKYVTKIDQWNKFENNN
jgi:hypothetical protein